MGGGGGGGGGWLIVNYNRSFLKENYISTSQRWGFSGFCQNSGFLASLRVILETRLNPLRTF